MSVSSKIVGGRRLVAKMDKKGESSSDTASHSA